MHTESIQLRIGGMTCIHCQTKIEQALRATPGVVKASVNYRTGTASVTYDPGRISLRRLAAVIERLDYQVLPQSASPRPALARTAGLLAVIVALYLLLQQTGLLNLLVPSQLADTGMGYGMLFVVGLLTSVHCIAMCGGINLSQCIPQGDTPEGGGAVFRPALLYNLGRVLSYTAIGFCLGGVGLALGGGSGGGVPTLLQGILKLIAGALMVIMGVNMLGLFPWLRRLQPMLPRALTTRLGEQRAKTRRPLVVGLLNGLMPCGPLQSMQIVALASGSPLSGALSMLVFSLGTVPLMLGLGSLVSALGRRFARAVTGVGAVLVTVLGLAMLSQGGSLSGLLLPDRLLRLILALCVLGVAASLPLPKTLDRGVCLACAAALLLAGGMVWSHMTAAGAPQSAAAAEESQLVDGVQVVSSTLTLGRYPTITVQASTPVRWTIDAPAGSINGCNFRMILDAFGVEHTFETGENVIEFFPAEAGVYPYTCWMGMIRGTVYVTDPDGDDAAGSVPVSSDYRIPTDELAVAVIGRDSDGSTIQEVTIRLTDTGFSPAVVVAQAGIPAVWTIEVDRSDGAGVSLLAPAYATSLDLQAGENQLYFAASESFDVSTGDSQFFAYVKVVEALDLLDADAIRAEVDAYVPTVYPAGFFADTAASASCCS